ncbi:ethyl tert-butyl ether degradation protein EthD [Pantoea wallisii]|uniref:Ethyl tert-butyl ether degradation protein EthD n=1 Tax=Pantoea wallisii TaxID=1076551 RepID=A0A1X1D4P9_9GAMM|nr:EthD family reductase [Pantoea wallisii]ORM71491.1 ethyl tert-butyl ether degradation protein EthD [Pantoea wallisii]
MHKMIVVCAGDEKNRFDREYYTNVHLPLASECWKPYGLVSAEAFYPATSNSDWLSIGVYTFKTAEAINHALNAKITEKIMADVPFFTDATIIIRSHFTPF